MSVENPPWMETRPVKNRCILLVEDDPDSREVLAEILEEEGYGVSLAANGREALDHLRCSPRPDLILMVLMMPVMDGWEFRNRQRQDPALSSVPVVVISATTDLARKAASIGAADFLQKPIPLDRLLAIVARHCGEPATNGF